MNCQNCKSSRVAQVNGKTSDLCYVRLGDFCESDGYVPDGFGIGKGDYIEFCHCLDCGQMQGKFPLKKTLLEMEREDE